MAGGCVEFGKPLHSEDLTVPKYTFQCSLEHLPRPWDFPNIQKHIKHSFTGVSTILDTKNNQMDTQFAYTVVADRFWSDIPDIRVR